MSANLNIKQSVEAWCTIKRVAKKSQGRSQFQILTNNKGDTATKNAEKQLI